MKFIEVLRGRIAEMHATRAEKVSELEAVLAAAETESRATLTDDENARFETLKAEIEALDGEIDTAEARAAELDQIAERARAASIVPTSPVPGAAVPADVIEDRSATRTQLADALTRALEPRVEDADNMAHVRALARRHSGDGNWVRRMIARSSDLYEQAFAKVVTGQAMFLTPEEARSLAVGTNTQGGFSVPTHLDPTIILTNSGTDNAIRAISRVVSLTEGNVWNGVTSAGSTASWDAELAAVSDDSPSLARASVPLYKAQAFVGASIEAMSDIQSVASDVLMLFADARDRLEGTAHATGSGSSQPTGIFTALDANTNVELTSTTAATIGLADLQTVWRSVPTRWRRKSTWVMNPLYSTAIQALGTAVSASYSNNLTEEPTQRLLGRPVVETDDAPTTQTTTVRDNEIVLGDFSNFLIVDKPGSMTVKYIDVMFDASTALPNGTSGWYAYWRSGSDSVNDVAFRLLQDKTSA